MGSVAYVNSVRIVWDNSLGFATAVGFPVDSELVELLFTSLLIQATRSMSHATGSSNRSRSPSFRRAFLVSYADRILERLEQARIHAGTEAALEYGSSLLPILANRKDIVADVTEALFPGTSPMRPRRVDAQGWHAGRLAADMASLATGRDEIRR